MTDRPTRESMSLEEATISNMWEIAAIVELLERQAHISRVFYIHPWVPKDDANAEMDAEMKKEYKKILGKLHITHLDSFKDPAERWAVASKRNKLGAPKPDTTKSAA